MQVGFERRGYEAVGDDGEGSEIIIEIGVPNESWNWIKVLTRIAIRR